MLSGNSARSSPETSEALSADVCQEFSGELGGDLGARRALRRDLNRSREPLAGARGRALRRSRESSARSYHESFETLSGELCQ